MILGFFFCGHLDVHTFPIWTCNHHWWQGCRSVVVQSRNVAAGWTHLFRTYRASHYVLNRYHNISSADDMLNKLKWPTLQDRRKISCLSMIFKIINSLVEVPSHQQYLIPSKRQSRHKSKSYQVSDKTKGYIQDSFYPRTIREWNSLPEDTVTAPSISSFKNKLIKL